VSVTSGYAGGTEADPTYEKVSSGATSHAESVQVLFDPKKVSYDDLLEVFWRDVDPTTADRQFCDVGRQYRSAIFYESESQQAAARASKKKLEDSGTLEAPVVTEIAPVIRFYPAEEYHQDYAKKNPAKYKYYRKGCGRDQRLKELWGDAARADDPELR
jgi:peptide-methionine (S)-S-oxide reductase